MTVIAQSAKSPTESVRLRPDVSTNVETLGANSTSDAAARAGWEAYQRGDLESARTALAVAAANPDVEAWVHYALGQSEYALRQFHDAAKSWETVRKRAPDFEPVYFDLVDAYLQLKEHDVAIRVLRSAEQRWPDDSELFNALGVVQTSRGALDDAVKSFQQAIAKAPEDGTGYFNLAKALELRYNRSRRYVQQTRTWFVSGADRDAAIENYERYLQIGGPFADSAREGLTRLQWTPK
jgi:tetratricopeptide (TPR) repeat protein